MILEKIKSRNKKGALLLAGIILLAALSRLLPHPWNFTPVGAISLFGAAYYSNKWMAIAIPLLSLWISDLVLNNTVYASFYKGFYLMDTSMLAVYAGFIAMGIIAILLLKKASISKLISAAIAGPLVYWLFIDFVSWMGNPLYPQNFAGLMTSYAAGLPFIIKMMCGNFVYGALLFGAFEWMRKQVPALHTKTA